MNAVLKSSNYRISAILLCFAAAGQTFAKNIDYTPDISSDAYWDTHRMEVVRVTAAGTSITYQVENAVTEGSAGQVKTVPLNGLWFGLDAGGSVPVAVNDRLILYQAKEGRAPVVAIRIESGPAGSQSLADLQQIARLRHNRADHQAYIANLAGSPTVARYCLRHLLEQPAGAASSEDVATLLRLRNDESQDLRVRVLAGRLAGRLEGGGDYSDADYSWLQAALAGSKTQRWQDLAPLVDRLLDFAARRSDSIVFLTQLVTNPDSALPARIVAYGAFEDRRMFNFEMPDAESERIFETCTHMLEDGEPAIRGAGAALLHNIGVRVNGASSPGYLKRSRTALANALAAESIMSARRQLEHYLELLPNR